MIPLLFFFCGMDCPPGLESFGIENFAEATPTPCIVVTPIRPKGVWWVLSKKRGGCPDFGHCDGVFQKDWAKAYVAWMRVLCRVAGRESWVDAERPRALGFSSGAYALTEILVQSGSQPLIWSLGLGGLHGNGEPDLTEIKRWKKLQRGEGDEILEKFDAYLERLRWHPGAPGGIFCFHHPEDNVCSYKNARTIADVLSKRQAALHQVALEFKDIWATDRPPSATDHKGRERVVPNHDYQDTTFLDGCFLKQFLQEPKASGGNQEMTRLKLVARSRSRSKSDVVRLQPRLRKRSDSRHCRLRGRSPDAARSRRTSVMLVARSL